MDLLNPVESRSDGGGERQRDTVRELREDGGIQEARERMNKETLQMFDAP